MQLTDRYSGDNITEKYELDDACIDIDFTPVGVLILYLLARYDGLDFISLEATTGGNIDNTDNKFISEDMTYFSNLDELIDLFSNNGYESWRLTVEYLGAKVIFDGMAHANILIVNKHSDKDVDVRSLINHIENETYEYVY